MTGTIRALVECQIDECALEHSYHLDMVRLFVGQPICQDCYELPHDEPPVSWSDLPPVELKDLRA